MSPIAPAVEGNGSPKADAVVGLERRRSRLPFTILGLVLVGVFGVTAYQMFAKSVVYYYTPTETLSLTGEQVRLSGTVVPGSVEQSVTEGTVTFEVTDGTSSIPVVYYGPAPDTLKDEAEAVAEGKLGEDGVFRADTLFAKCPSKFESKPEA